jgi:hypothetical protein
MSHVGRVWLVCILAGWAFAACKDDVHQYDVPAAPQVGTAKPADDDAGTADAGEDDTAEDDDDRTTESPADRPTRPPSRPRPSDDDDEDADDEDADDEDADADDDDDGDDNGDREPDETPDEEEPEPDPDLPPVAGTAGPAGCYSYTTPSDGMCGSHYCGVTEAQLRAEIPDDSVCGDAEFACSGNLVTVSGDCARRIKGNMPFASNEALRPSIVNCVNEDPEIAERVSAGCLDCFLDALDCVSQACLTDCLNGNSPQCDACAQSAGCFDPVFSCGGLPNPG